MKKQIAKSSKRDDSIVVTIHCNKHHSGSKRARVEEEILKEFEVSIRFYR